MSSLIINKKVRINSKDLINTGIFTALYLTLYFATGMLGLIPVLMVVKPFLCPLVCGVVFMLFLTKVDKFGMVTIMGIVLSLLMFVTGHGWPTLVVGVLSALASDLILKTGNYKKWNTILLGYVVFSQLVIGMLIPMFFMRESSFNMTREGYGEAYVNTLQSITPPWVFWLMIGLVALGAIIGAYIGRALLKKHFKRAGIA